MRFFRRTLVAIGHRPVTKMSQSIRRRLALAVFLLLPLAISAGCGGGSAGSPDGGTGAAGTGGAGTGGAVDPNAVVGGFTVKLLDQTPGASQVSGTVNDRPKHELVIWEQMAKDG